MKAALALRPLFTKTTLLATTMGLFMGIAVAEAQRPLPPPIMPPGGGHGDRLLQSTLLQAQSLSHLLQQRGHQLLRPELLQVSQLLGQAEAVINNLRPPHPPIHPPVYPPRPPVRPPHQRDLVYTGICHVDDDTTFAYDQFVVGELRAYSVQELIRQCKDQAYGMYGDRGSSGIKTLTVEGDVPYGAYMATCHLDDDTAFAFSQFVPGTLVGSLEEITQQCQDLAQDAFGYSSSSGLNNIQPRGIPRGSLSADCHIDDDIDFAFDQFVLGRLYGADVIDVRNRCQRLADAIFGSAGSAGVRNTQYH